MTTLRSIGLRVDVTEAAGLGEPAHVALTVTVPDELASEPVVCFGKPGGGYARGYYTVDLPGPADGAQADWHAERGWIFVSVDHLGVGDSSLHDPERLSYTPVVAASQAAEADVLQKLAAGTLHGRAPESRAPPDDRHRAVDGWLPHGGATGPLPLLRRDRSARLQRAAHAPADGTGHAAPRHAVGAP